MRGSRIQAIVRELNNEKIDIVNFSEKPEILISRALSPAKPTQLFIDDEKKYCVALFEDESLDAAIGRNGMNINLASKITDYRIDAYGINQYQRIQEDQKTLLMDIEGVDKKIAKVLLDSNIKVVSDLLDADMDNLLAINSITEDILDDIYTSVQDFVERKIEIPSIDEGDDEQDDVENPDLENKPVTEPVE
tara:strand:- start:792 stop:1367 length:576 start_codon:yes stop_codon:yes gene_type:complete